MANSQSKELREDIDAAKDYYDKKAQGLPLDDPRETVADAILNLGGKADYKLLAEVTDLTPKKIEKIVTQASFPALLEKRCIELGLDSRRFQQRINTFLSKLSEVYHKKLDADINNPDVDLSRQDILRDMKALQSVAKLKAQTEVLNNVNDSGKQMMNKAEALKRMMDSPVGKDFINKYLASANAPEGEDDDEDSILDSDLSSMKGAIIDQDA